jgi:ribosomal protein S6--L-glutamate ligase/gamma-F420-2:alpha-L-glutamate ligase
MNKHGWIIYNGSLPGNKFLDFAEWIQEAAAKKNSTAAIYQNNELAVIIGKTGLQFLEQQRLPDYVVFTDKDIYLARQLEIMGIPVFNSADAIEISDDKISTYLALSRQKLVIPKTINYPKVFGNGFSDYNIIDTAIKQLGLPVVVKEAFGSFGEQVYLLHDKKELFRKVQELKGKAFIFQEFVATSCGKDIRLHVVGDRVVAGMKRTSSTDFRANVTTGGQMEAYEANEEEKELAIRAAKAIGADFAGVDLLFGPNETPVICEVNSNAHIRNMYECTKINVADYIMDYILEKIGSR